MDDQETPAGVADPQSEENTATVKDMDLHSWKYLVISTLAQSVTILLSWRFGSGLGLIINYTTGPFFPYFIWSTSLLDGCSTLPHKISSIMFPCAGCLSLILGYDAFFDISSAFYVPISVIYLLAPFVATCLIAGILYFLTSHVRDLLQKEYQDDWQELKTVCMGTLRRGWIAHSLVLFFLIQGISGFVEYEHAVRENIRHNPFCSYSEDSRIGYTGDTACYHFDNPIPIFDTSTSFISYEEARARTTAFQNDYANILGHTSTTTTEFITIHDFERINSIKMIQSGIISVLSGVLGGQALVITLLTYDMFVQVAHITFDDVLQLSITILEGIWILCNFVSILLVVVLHIIPEIFLSKLHFFLFLSGSLMITCLSISLLTTKSIQAGKHKFYNSRLAGKQSIQLMNVNELEESITLLRAAFTRRQYQALQRAAVIEQLHQRVNEQSADISQLQARLLLDNDTQKDRMDVQPQAIFRRC